MDVDRTKGASLLVARVRPGPSMANSYSAWEITTGDGANVSPLAMRPTEAEAQAFADGYNLGVRHGQWSV